MQVGGEHANSKLERRVRSRSHREGRGSMSFSRARTFSDSLSWSVHSSVHEYEYIVTPSSFFEKNPTNFSFAIQGLNTGAPLYLKNIIKSGKP